MLYNTTKLDDTENSQQTHPSTPQNKSEDIIEESPEVIDNIENSSHADDMSNGKQQFVSPSPQVSTVSFTPQLDVSYTPPPQLNFPPIPGAYNFPPTTLGTGKDVPYLNNNTLKPQTAPSLSTQSTIASSNYPSPLTSPLNFGEDMSTLQSQGDDDDKRSEASDLSEVDDEQSYTPNNEQSYTHCFFSQSDLSTSENTLVLQLKQANAEISRLQGYNNWLNEQSGTARQKLEKAEELKSAFFTYLKEQAQQLTQLFQQENETQKIEELVGELSKVNECLIFGELNVTTIKRLNELWKKTEEIRNKPNENAPSRELGEENEQMEELNAEVEKLKKDLEAKNTEFQQLQKEKKELEAKKQPTEQSEAPTYTAAVGCGLAAGLVAFIALERTVRLDIWATVGIALVAALAVSGATYLALKPSTQVNEAEAQEVNNNALEK